MLSIKFTCEIITPMFIGNASTQETELRPPAIKAAMRFWWRAMNADLVTKDHKGNWDYSQLLSQEVQLFGGQRDEIEDGKPVKKAYKSSFQIVCSNSEGFSRAKQPPLPHKPNGFAKIGFTVKQECDITFLFRDTSQIEMFKSLMRIALCLGGLGNRSRRGMGCLSILKIDDNPINYTINELHKDLELLKGKAYFTVKGDEIKSKFDGIHFSVVPPYPNILKITWGSPKKVNFLFQISKKTSDLLAQTAINNQGKTFEYTNTMGYAMGQKRFASPTYISFVENKSGLVGIITELVSSSQDNGKINKTTSSIIQEFKKIIS